MRSRVPAIGTTRLKRIGAFWPYILIVISILGLAIRIWRGTF